MNTIPELLSETVAKHKNRIAIVEEGKKVSYLELQSMVNSLSSYLTSLGVKPGDRVAILLPNSIEFIARVFQYSKHRGNFGSSKSDLRRGRDQVLYIALHGKAYTYTRKAK
jgi:non-ribosomal peptide synthetase component F